MNPVWQIDLASRTFIPCFTSKDVTWHESVFVGYNEGIIDRNGPTELAGFACDLNEIIHLHALVRQEPNYFFGTDRVCWIHTGQLVGEAPDIMGFGNEQDIHIGEVKWRDGWHRRLRTQVASYASKLWSGDFSGKRLVIEVACPQTAHRTLISDLIDLTQQFSTWEHTTIRFGFMQLGWRIIDRPEYFLRIIWVNGESWYGAGFSECAYTLGLHGK
jgi:hypothetical protein